MQKFTYILLATLAFVYPAFAGEDGQELTTAGITVDQFPHFGGNFNGKAAPANVRLISKVYSVFSRGMYIIQDSSTYSYAQNRGGVPDLEQPNKDDHLLFDESYKYRYIPITRFYKNEQYRQQVFDATNHVSQLTYRDWESSGQAWKNKERYIYDYDLGGKMTSTVFQQWVGSMWTNNVISKVTYNAQNNISELTSVTYKLQFDYDVNGKHLIEIVDKAYNSTTGSWDNNIRKSYTYSGDDISTYTFEKWSAATNSWVKEEKWIYSYNTVHQVIYSEHKLWSGASWLNNKEYDHVYINNNEVERVEKVWNISKNKYVENQKITFTYNTYNQPETYETASWNGVTWYMNDGDKLIKYYYEQYDPTNINSLKIVNTSLINVYPVPAKDKIYIHSESVFDNTTISVTDMSGRILITETVSGLQTYPMHLSDLPNGNYMLSIMDNNMNVTKKITISH